MRDSIRPRRGPLTKLLATLLVVAVLNILAATLVFAIRHDDPRVPFFPANGADPRPGADAYVPLPAAYGFTTWSVPPQVVTDAGLVRLKVRGRATADPDVSAGYALAALATYAEDHNPEWLARAGRAVEDALRTSRDGVVEHTEPATGEAAPTGTLPDPWVSAKTQGLMLSALTRLAAATDGLQAERYRARANAVFDTLLRFRDPVEGHVSPLPWFSLIDTNRYIWFEQFPQAAEPTLNLTGHIFALTGLYDYLYLNRSVGRRHDAAVTLVKAGLGTVERYISDVRVPDASAWMGPTRVERSRQLHDILIVQLRELAWMSGDARYREFSNLLNTDTAVNPYLTTGLRPRGDVDAYSWPSVLRVLPPTSRDVTDRLNPERAAPRSQRSPDVLASAALADLARYGQNGRANSLARAERSARRLLNKSEFGLVPHAFRTTNIGGQRLANPWYSAQTQGLLLSALVRLESATGRRQWADAAHAVFATLQRSRNTYRRSPAEATANWLSYVGDDKGSNLWFDMYVPQIESNQVPVPSYLVDAHLAAVIGIYDYWRMTKNPVAARLFDGGASTLVAWLPEIRRSGNVSATAVVWPIYRLDHHRVLTRQIAAMSRMTSDPLLARYAQRLSRDAP